VGVGELQARKEWLQKNAENAERDAARVGWRNRGDISGAMACLESIKGSRKQTQEDEQVLLR
jgi:hypothetical protein